MNSAGIGYGKLLLFGEHSAVYGYPALGTSLPISTRLFLSGTGTKGAEPVPELVRPPLRAAWREIQAALESRGVPAMEERENLDYLSSVPMGSGFGSSAAACVALARLISPAECDTATLWWAANCGERVFHGTPSGIDTGLALGGGLFLIEFGGDRIPVRTAVSSAELYLVAGTVARERSTKELVAGLAELRRRDPTRVQSALDRLGAITQDAAQFLRRKRASTIGSLADEAQSLLRSLELSSDTLEEVLTLAKKAGASGAKLSGAGGGGAFYAIAPDMETAMRIAARLEEHPACRTIPPFNLSKLVRDKAEKETTGAALEGINELYRG